MARPDVMTRLADGERLLMDGAMGSELHRRGVEVARGAPQAIRGRGRRMPTSTPGQGAGGPRGVPPGGRRHQPFEQLLDKSSEACESRSGRKLGGHHAHRRRNSRAGSGLGEPDAYVAGAIAPPGTDDPDVRAHGGSSISPGCWLKQASTSYCPSIVCPYRTVSQRWMHAARRVCPCGSDSRPRWRAGRCGAVRLWRSWWPPLRAAG